MRVDLLQITAVVWVVCMFAC